MWCSTHHVVPGSLNGSHGEWTQSDDVIDDRESVKREASKNRRKQAFRSLGDKGGDQKSSGPLCKWGAECRKEVCKFVHPRAVPPGPPPLPRAASVRSASSASSVEEKSDEPPSQPSVSVSSASARPGPRVEENVRKELATAHCRLRAVQTLSVYDRTVKMVITFHTRTVLYVVAWALAIRLFRAVIGGFLQFFLTTAVAFTGLMYFYVMGEVNRSNSFFPVAEVAPGAPEPSLTKWRRISVWNSVRAPGVATMIYHKVNKVVNHVRGVRHAIDPLEALEAASLPTEATHDCVDIDALSYLGFNLYRDAQIYPEVSDYILDHFRMFNPKLTIKIQMEIYCYAKYTTAAYVFDPATLANSITHAYTTFAVAAFNSSLNAPPCTLVPFK